MSSSGNGRSGDAAMAGIGFGSALAITISWSANHSILWAMLHGGCRGSMSSTMRPDTEPMGVEPERSMT